MRDNTCPDFISRSMQKLSDEELMVRFITGEQHMLAILYKRHRHSLLNYLYRITANPALCEDLVQNVFLRIMKYKNRFSGNGSFRAWLFRIARNAALDTVQSAHFRYSSSLFPQCLQADSLDAENHFIKNEKICLLQKGLQSLKPPQREIIALSKIDRISVREMADILNCSESAVKVRVFRALRELRKKISNLEGIENEK